MPRKQSRRTKRRKRAYTPTRGVFKGRRFGSERSYRTALRDLQQRLAPGLTRVRSTPVYTALQASQLTPDEEQDMLDALKVVSLMRREGRTFRSARRQGGVSPTKVWRYAAPALRVDTRGQIQVRPRDQLYREVLFWTVRGQKSVPTRDSRLASRIGQHNWAVRRYRQTGDQGPLKRFEGKSIQVGRERLSFITDPLTLKRLTYVDPPEYEFYARLA